MLNRTKPTHLLLYLVLGLWVGVLYFSTLLNPFVYDDRSAILENPALLSFDTTAAYYARPVEFSSDFDTGSGAMYRPLFWLSLFADRATWDLNAAGFHLTNLVLHLINGVLVFLLFLRLLNQHVAFVSALAWISLPIHSEVVAWVSARGLSLSAMFVLLAVLGAETYVKKGGVGWASLVVAGSGGALLSHEAGVAVLPLAFLMAAFSRGPSRSNKTIFTISACAAVPLGLYLSFRTFSFGFPADHIGTIREILLWAPVSLAKYVWWSISAPAMSMERSTELAGVTFRSWIYGFAWLTLGAISALAVRFRHLIPTLPFGMLWLFLSLLPFLHVLPLYQSMAERYVYLGSVGVVLAVVSALSAIQIRLGLPRWVILGLVGVWAGVSVAPLNTRVHAWSEARLLYTTSLETSPQSHVLNHNLGFEHQQLGETEAAISFYEKAISLKPDYVMAHLGLADLYFSENNFTEARQAYRHLLEHAPSHFQAQLNLAAILLIEGETDDGITLLRSLVDENPDRFEGRVNLGAVLIGYGDPSEARLHLEAALRLQPDSAEAAYNLGLLERDLGRTDQARALFLRALRYRPDHRRAEEALQTLE